MGESHSNRWWIAAEATVALTMISLVIALGGAPEWTNWIIPALGSLALGLWTVGAVRSGRRLGPNILWVIPLFVAAISAIQLVTLPPWLLASLSPPAAELREFVLIPLGLDAWRPLSMDAPSTWRTLGRSLGCLSICIVTTELCFSEEVRRRLLSIVALTGLAVAVFGFAHKIADTDQFFGGIRVFTFSNPPLVTPFGNTNHLAAYLTLSGTVALGLSLTARSNEALIAWAAAAFACGVGVFLSFSRGGVATFLVTWTVVAAAVVAKRRSSVRAFVVLALLGATMIYAGGVALDQLLARLDTVSTFDKLSATKIELWPMLFDSANATWRFGKGLGAFEIAFPRFQEAYLTTTFTHPEMVILQWANEVGWPAAIAFFVLVATVAFRVWFRVAKLTLERTAFIGLAGIVLHDVFDFALELNGLLVSAVVVASALAGVARNEKYRHRVSVRSIAAPVGLAMISLAAMSRSSPSAQSAETQLIDAVRSGQSWREVRSLAVQSIDRHPAHWTLYANAAFDSAKRADARETIFWVNRWLFLRPKDAQAHAAAAIALTRLDRPQQALLEFRTAWLEGDTNSLEPGVALAVREGAWGELVIDRAGHLTNVDRLLRSHNRTKEALVLLDAAVSLATSDVVRSEAHLLRVQHLAQFESPAVALAAVDALDPELKAQTGIGVLRSRLLARMAKLDEAIAALEPIVVREPQNLDAATQLSAFYVQAHKPSLALDVIDRVRPFVVSAGGRSTLYQVEAQLHLAEQRYARALTAYQTASRIEPTRADLHYRIAQVYEAMQRYQLSLESMRVGRSLDSPQGAAAQENVVKRLEQGRSVQLQQAVDRGN